MSTTKSACPEPAGSARTGSETPYKAASRVSVLLRSASASSPTVVACSRTETVTLPVLGTSPDNMDSSTNA
ncbi:MAG: hypothetical protein IPN53_04335 [Comamonadaceae bacterium]|nr:hypothetical protein [Comamonadaceae bacterium]